MNIDKNIYYTELPPGTVSSELGDGFYRYRHWGDESGDHRLTVALFSVGAVPTAGELVIGVQDQQSGAVATLSTIAYGDFDINGYCASIPLSGLYDVYVANSFDVGVMLQISS